MSVHYKFKNTINYSAVKFDGVYISASDLKNIIVQQNKLGHSELQIKNEETGQSYTDDQLIPKNTNIIASRLPFANSNKRTRLMASQPYPTTRFSSNGTGGSNNHQSHNNRHSASSSTNSTSNHTSTSSEIGGGREAMELVSTKNMSEEEKIKYIQSQSTKDFDPNRYARGGRGGGGLNGNRNRGHTVPGPGYVCRKCGIPGHLINDCKSSTMHKVKRSSGIPRSFLIKVDSTEKGALVTPSGEHAIPIVDRDAYNNPKVEKAPFFEDGVPSHDQIEET